MLGFKGSINKLIFNWNRSLIDSAVHSCVVFPKAVSLTKPSLHQITVEKFSADMIRTKMNEDQSLLMSLYSPGARTDAEDYPQIIEVLKGKAPVDGLRFIQFRKAGIDVLRINLADGEQNERAAFIEMNEYKRQFLKNANNRNSNILLIAAICSTGIIFTCY